MKPIEYLLVQMRGKTFDLGWSSVLVEAGHPLCYPCMTEGKKQESEKSLFFDNIRFKNMYECIMSNVEKEK